MSVTDFIQNLMDMLETSPTIKPETQHLLLQLADKIYSVYNNYTPSNDDICMKKTKTIRERLMPHTQCDIVCVKCDIKYLDYMSTAFFRYIIDNVTITISHGVADSSSRYCYYFIEIDDIELAQDADLYDVDWISDCEPKDVEQCQKILNNVNFDLKWLIHLI